MNARAFRPWLFPIAVFGASLVVFGIVSRLTAPAFDELSLLASVDQKAEIVKRVAARGFDELTQPEIRAALEPQPALFGLFGAWAKLTLGRAVDPLTAERLPWLVLGAFGVLSVYAMLRPTRSAWVAIGAALLLLLTPRFLHAVVVRREAALVTCSWLIVLAAYARSLGPKRMLCWLIAAAIALGFGVALSFGTLWVVIPILVHFAWLRARSTRRLLRHGRLPVPSFALLALAISPLVMFAVSPGLWRQTGAGVARFLLSPLAPSIARSEYAGKVVSAPPVPGGFAFASLVQTLPWLILIAAIAGFFGVIHESLARRFASGRLRPARDRHRIPLLAMLALVGAIIGPALEPEVLTTFPPRVELALPFLAILAAVGAERLIGFAPSPRLRLLLSALVLGLLALTTLSAPSTLAAATSPFVGGAGRLARSHALPLGDGSELGAVAAAIDRLGADTVGLHAPSEIAPEYWETLRKARRMRTLVGHGGSISVALVRGKATSGERVAEIKRDGAVLWTLVR